MSRHTRGPWSTYGDRNGRVSKIESRTGRVCTIQRSDKNGDANARLISAAPDLLGACQRALEQTDQVARSSDYAMLRAAIAKATGATP